MYFVTYKIFIRNLIVSLMSILFIKHRTDFDMNENFNNLCQFVISRSKWLDDLFAMEWFCNMNIFISVICTLVLYASSFSTIFISVLQIVACQMHPDLLKLASCMWENHWKLGEVCKAQNAKRITTIHVLTI